MDTSTTYINLLVRNAAMHWFEIAVAGDIENPKFNCGRLLKVCLLYICNHIKAI